MICTLFKTIFCISSSQGGTYLVLFVISGMDVEYFFKGSQGECFAEIVKRTFISFQIFEYHVEKNITFPLITKGPCEIAISIRPSFRGL